MNDKPRSANDDSFEDTGSDSISEPTVPVADKGKVARAHRDDQGLADGLATTPRPRSEAAEQLASEDGLIDPEPSVDPLDFSDGSMPTDALTQGRSVIEAEFEDRGRAEHLDADDPNSVHPGAAADNADPSDGDVASDTGVRTVQDAALPDDDTGRD